MHKAHRLVMTMLIACGLVSGLSGAATGQGTGARTFEAFELTRRAEALYNAGRLDEALPLAERAVAVSGDNYPEIEIKYSLTSPLGVLAKLYRAKGDYQRAETTLRRLLASIENSPGGAKERLPSARAHNELAAVYEAMGDYARALQSRIRGSEIIERNLTRFIKPGAEPKSTQDKLGGGWDELRDRGRILMGSLTGGEDYKQSLMDSLASETSATVSLHVLHLPQDRQAAQFAATTILQRKGRVLDAVGDQLNTLRRYGTQQDLELINQLTRVYAKASAMTNEGSQGPDMGKVEEIRQAIVQGVPMDEIRRRMDREVIGPVVGNFTQTMQIQAEIRRLENAIGQRSAELRTPEPPVTLAAIRQAIPDDAALVEIFLYEPFNAKARTEAESFGVPRYVAYVLRRSDDAPQWVELGDAADIDEAASRFRGVLRDKKRVNVRELARAMDERVMRPIRKLLGPVRRIFLAPDGALNLIPFAALIDENNRYLIEGYSLNYLTTGRDLLRLQVGGESRGEPRAFANPSFDLTPDKKKSGSETQSSRPDNQTLANPFAKDLTSVNYKPLPGTAAEAVAFSRVFPDATVLTKEQATEAAMKGANRPRVLHVATHGFFLADTPQREASLRASAAPRAGDSRVSGVRAFFPLLRSGLILAGVRQRASGADEDGILTALEMTAIDLWGTRLVMLSACETGLGDVKNGEGVYGLRRALVLAGSQTQVITLWKVSDLGARDLMIAYYTLLRDGVGRTEALRQVQLEMLRGKLVPSPVTISDKQDRTRETGDVEGEPVTKDYRHPYYWASFIASGDWRSMDGK